MRRILLYSKTYLALGIRRVSFNLKPVASGAYCCARSSTAVLAQCLNALLNTPEPVKYMIAKGRYLQHSKRGLLQMHGMLFSARGGLQ